MVMLAASAIAAGMHQSELDKVIVRVSDLAYQNDDSRLDRARIRNIMDGGPRAVAELLGTKASVDERSRMPVANLMLSASTRLAQKLGRAPDVKVDVPDGNESDSAQRLAHRRARIVTAMDEVTNLELQLPQVGRWLPGYGYAVWQVRQGRDVDGQPWPVAELRDPYETVIGEWGVAQQPESVGFLRIASPERLAREFPAHADAIMSTNSRSPAGRMLVDRSGTDRRGWESQSGQGVEVWEYVDRSGTWFVLPEQRLVLAHIPNPLGSDGPPPFVAMKRFAFSRLTGQYDHVIGLMSSLARLNLLTVIATEDAVMAETFVAGEIEGGVMRRGRNAVNYLSPGSTVSRLNSNVPQQAFQNLGQLERQLRVVAGYSVQDDGQSPNSFVTGRGLQELQNAVGNEVREYQSVIADGLRRLDHLRLAWDEELYPDRSKSISGVLGGSAFAETYKPRTHIKGFRRTRRVYGAMAGFDDATKIITGLQLLQADIIDDDTMRENIDGLYDHARIKDRIRNNKVETALLEAVGARAQQGDPAALAAVIKMLPEGATKELLTEVLLPQMEDEAEVVAQEEQAAANPLADLIGGQPPSSQTVLQRLSAGAGGRVSPVSSVQNVGTIGG